MPTTQSVEDFNKRTISNQKSSGQYDPAFSGSVQKNGVSQAASGSDIALYNEAMEAANKPQPQSRGIIGAGVDAFTGIVNKTVGSNIGGAVAGAVGGAVGSVASAVGGAVGNVPEQPQAESQQQVAGTEQIPAYTLGRDSNTMFEMLKSGELQAAPDIQAWNQMYENGVATNEQKRAWAQWMNWSKYKDMSGDQLLNALNSGTLTVNSPTWNDITNNGVMTPAQEIAYEEYKDQRDIDMINDQMAFTNDIISGAIIDAGEYSVGRAGPQARLDDMQGKISDILATPVPSAKAKFDEYIVNNQELKELNDKAIDLEKEMQQIDVQTLYLKDEIVALVDGEASQGHVNALAAERSADLYKKKSMLALELNAVTGKLSYETEIAKSSMEYELQDEQNQFNRLMQIATHGLDMAKFEQQMAREGLQDELAVQGHNLNVLKFNDAQRQSFIDNQMKVQEYKRKLAASNTAEAQQLLENEIEMQKYLHTIPEGQVVTLSTGTYIGLGSDAATATIEHVIDGQVYVKGFDGSTGEEIYDIYIGAVDVDEGDVRNELEENRYQQALSDRANIYSGKLIRVGSKVYPREEYLAYDEAKDTEDIFQSQIDNYRKSYSQWVAKHSEILDPDVDVKWDKIIGSAPVPPEIPAELIEYYDTAKDTVTAETIFNPIKALREPVGREFKEKIA